MPTAVWHRDELLAEPSEIPLLALSRMAREHVTVVLSGEGATSWVVTPNIAPMPCSRGRVVLVAPPWASAGCMSLHVGIGCRDGRGWQLRPSRPPTRERWPRWFGADRQAGLSSDGVRPLDSVLAGLEGLSPLDRMLALDVESYLVDNLLVRGDKMTMAASIEGRMPLLDHDLAEYAARLPTEFKASPRRTKIVIREIARRRLPDSSFAQEDWLCRAGGVLVPGRPRRRVGAVDPRSGGASRSLVDPERVREALTLHRVGRYDLGKELWSL